MCANALGIAAAPAILDLQVAALGPAQLLQALLKRSDAGLSYQIICRRAYQDTNASHPLGLLRARRERTGDGCAAQQRDELAPIYPHRCLDPHCFFRVGSQRRATMLGAHHHYGTLRLTQDVL